MAEIDFLLGAAFLNQTVRGTPTTMATIGAGSGAAGAIDNVTDGAVLGSPTGGIGETGISVQIGKKTTEKAVITGSFSKSFANYVSRTTESFSITLPIKGNGKTTTGTPVAADFTPDIGIVALMRALGFTSAALGATWGFTPAATNIVTAALYFGNEASNGGRIILKDVEASSGTMSFTPGEVATLSVEMAAVYSSHDESGSWGATPFDYGNQSSLSGPPVTSVGFVWGPNTPAARSIGFTGLEIAFDNESETVPSSNSSTGESVRQTGRTITVTGTIDATDGEFLYEMNQVGESVIGNAEALSFQVGTAAGGSQTANAYFITLPKPELMKLEPAKIGGSQGWTIELIARAVSANAEFLMFYN